ncbi:quinon protein alcohol dehydrogenase-like superfamily [Hygrophoropsis aurantiaca]|uniref:Quinon protein alcohol dehydrogenase-like superfamily n=1 Tax=Hygrophoropsis aurantiaca TaxID=72124 RepID=A0ACB7ZWE5_9AGAM|nr:quinon protein alcohol dehydrogenase-like superfamily [Hygrophoropsis aurantiaca]
MTASASTELEDPTLHFPTKVFEGHTEDVWSVAYFHEKRIISGSTDKTVRIWNVECQEQEGESLVHDFGVLSIALSPDERRLMSGGGGVALWDLEGRTVVWKKEESEVQGYCVAYSPDGRLVAAKHIKAIVLLNAETGERIRDPLQFGESVSCLAFSPDGSRIAAGSSSGDVQVFDVATGETIVGLFKAHIKTVTSLVYALDGQQIITASIDGSIRVWDAATGQEIGDPMLGQERSIWQIVPSHDGQRLASASDDRTVRVWDLKTRRQIGGPLQAQDSRDFFSVAWSPDGRSIVAATKENIYLWDSPPLDDHTAIPQASVPTTSIAPLPVSATSLTNVTIRKAYLLLQISSRPRANSISSSILNLPAGSQPSNQTLATDKLPDDFFDSSPDLPGRVHSQISTIPIATVPLRSSIPYAAKPKTGPTISSTSVPSSSTNVFGRIGSRFRRDKHAPEAIEMQPRAPPKLPKYSPVGKVALGQADKRLYMDESKDKKPGPGDEEQEVLEDIDVNCWELFCAMIEQCFSCCKGSDAQGDDG